jgi:hypothetical protein
MSRWGGRGRREERGDEVGGRGGDEVGERVGGSKDLKVRLIREVDEMERRMDRG